MAAKQPKKPSAPKIDPEEVEAQKHVEEIMGPADPRYASDPLPPAMPDVSTLAEQSASKQQTVEGQVDAVEPSPSEDSASAEAQPEPEPNVEVTEGNEPSVQPEPQQVLEPVAEPPQQALPEEPNPEPPEKEDKATDAAVEDIMRTNADAALPEATQEAVVMKLSIVEKCKNAWIDWWGNPWKRYGTIIVTVVVLAVLIFVAPVRAAVLNAFGVRSSLLVHVFDGATNLPLQNAIVEVDGKAVKTNADGDAKVTGIHLGDQKVEIHKLAFATHTENVRFGVRIVELNDVTLKPVGTQLTYVFTDYLSGKPVQGVMLKSGEATAESDKQGKAVITIEPDSTKEAAITATKDGYRTDVLKVPSDPSTTTTYKLVPGNHAIFASKESGKYNVYKMYVDGKDRAVLLAGSGLEAQPPDTLPSPDGKRVAVASTRDNKRNKDGYLLTTLNIVDVSSAEPTAIEHAETVRLIGWQGNTLIYSQTVAGASAANPNRERIIAYDTSSNKRFQLASANYFVGEELVGNTLYYAVSATDPAAKTTFGYVDIDGSNQKRLYSGQVWALLRTDYEKMKLQTPDKWYEYTVGASALASTTPSGDQISRFYVDNPAEKQSVRVDVRDANGVLLVREITTGTEKEVAKQKGMQTPLYWLNDSSVVYRVSNANEVADYAVNIQGGQAKKIADVSPSAPRY